MKKEIVGLLLVLGILVGCGGGGGDDHAPLDAIVVAPKDDSAKVPSPGGGSLAYRDLNFIVQNSRGERVTGVEIELIANGFLADAFFIDKNGNRLGDYLKRRTDDSGVVSVSVQTDLPSSRADSDIEVVVSVDANVGASSSVWQAKITVQKLPSVVP